MRDRRQKSTRKIIYILTGISPNTWWTRLGNHRGRAIWTTKPRVFWSGDSRAIPTSPCNNPRNQDFDLETKSSRAARSQEKPSWFTTVVAKTEYGSRHEWRNRLQAALHWDRQPEANWVTRAERNWEQEALPGPGVPHRKRVRSKKTRVGWENRQHLGPCGRTAGAWPDQIAESTEPTCDDNDTCERMNWAGTRTWWQQNNKMARDLQLALLDGHRWRPEAAVEPHESPSTRMKSKTQ
jgi:hypothetical protein